MIESREFTVSEAAYLTGFNNMSFFYELYNRTMDSEDLEEIKKSKDNLLTKANELATKVYEEAAKNQKTEESSEDTKEDNKKYKQMLENVEGCKNGYKVLAQNIPQNAENVLDLGCRTGLELDEIFKIYPQISVTGIDLSAEMLEELKRKHGDGQ